MGDPDVKYAGSPLPDGWIWLATDGRTDGVALQGNPILSLQFVQASRIESMLTITRNGRIAFVAPGP
jgi:hypothetical protein